MLLHLPLLLHLPFLLSTYLRWFPQESGSQVQCHVHFDRVFVSIGLNEAPLVPPTPLQPYLLSAALALVSHSYLYWSWLWH